MTSKTSWDYFSNREWLRDIVGGKMLILCKVSALEYLELFVGYMKEKYIYVYAREKGKDENIEYNIINNFDEIDYVQFGNVLCTSVSQTINDMLREFENTDVQALVEALSNYYDMHNESFEGLDIKVENMKTFDYIKEWAINYYCEE